MTNSLKNVSTNNGTFATTGDRVHLAPTYKGYDTFPVGSPVVTLCFDVITWTDETPKQRKKRFKNLPMCMDCFHINMDLVRQELKEIKSHFDALVNLDNELHMANGSSDL